MNADFLSTYLSSFIYKYFFLQLFIHASLKCISYDTRHNNNNNTSVDTCNIIAYSYYLHQGKENKDYWFESRSNTVS